MQTLSLKHSKMQLGQWCATVVCDKSRLQTSILLSMDGVTITLFRLTRMLFRLTGILVCSLLSSHSQSAGGFQELFTCSTCTIGLLN